MIFLLHPVIEDRFANTGSYPLCCFRACMLAAAALQTGEILIVPWVLHAATRLVDNGIATTSERTLSFEKEKP